MIHCFGNTANLLFEVLSLSFRNKSELTVKIILFSYISYFSSYNYVPGK